MKPHIILWISFFVALSCDEDPWITCGANPVEDQAWLAGEIQEMEESGMSQFLYVSQARLGLMTVFTFRNCCPYCSTVVPVYSCSGDRIGFIGYGEGGINPNALANEVVVWKPDNSACTFQ